MTQTTESKDLNLTTVLEAIYKGDYQLPEFQRDYVWKDINIKSLFESVLYGHPIGTILILEINKENPIMAWTSFSEIIPAPNRQMNYEEGDKNPPDFLVLDGQQRLTSMCHITHGTSKSTWYLDLIPIKESWQKNGKPSEKDNLRSWIETSLEISDYIKKGKKANDPMRYFRGSAKKMPLPILKDKNIFLKSLNDVRDGISQIINEKNYEKKNYKKLNLSMSLEDIEATIEREESWRDFLGVALPALIENYFEFKLPTVVVSKEMGITGVCKVFTKINTTGIELGAFDLIVAVMYPKKIRVKQLFDDAIDKYPLLKTLDSSSKRYILHTLALLGDKSPKTASLPDVLKVSDFNNNWDKAIQNIDEACRAVDQHCGAFLSLGTDRYLVYSPLISVLAYVINTSPIEAPKDLQLSILRSHKLKAWYFGSGITNRYSEGTDAKQLKDKIEMSAWFASSSFEDLMPQWLLKVYGSLNSSKSSATGKAIVSLFNISLQQDFYEGKRVGPGVEDLCDLHHIFPKAAMRNKIMKERNIRDKDAADKILKSEYGIDSILNQTWILATTNRIIIQDRMPSVYLNEIIRHYGGGDLGKDKLLRILAPHMISSKGLDYLLADDYISFVEERKRAILTEIKTTCHVRNIIEEGEINVVENEEDIIADTEDTAEE